MNLQELNTNVREFYSDKKRGLPCFDHPKIVDRITRSRIQDLNSHTKNIYSSLGRPSAEAVNAVELTDENMEVLRQTLKNNGKGKKVIENTISTFKLLRDLAIECGVPIAIRPKGERPKQHQIYCLDDEGKYTHVAKTGFGNYESYGHPYRDWSPALQKEYKDKVLGYYVDPLADHFNGKVKKASFLKTVLNRAERAFGFALIKGYKPEELSLRLLANYEFAVAYRKFLHPRRGGIDTMTTKGDLDQLRDLALNIFEDKATSDKISEYMRKRCHFETVKNKQSLVERVHADDLYFVFQCLVTEAQHYEATLKRKYGRISPEAHLCYHWMCAAAWGFTLLTWLRQANVAEATNENIFKKNGAWHFRFRAGMMKGDRPKEDQVIDLWEGDATQSLIYYALDKAVEFRPYLVQKYRMQHPDAPEPEEFFLNMDGKGYSKSALRLFFSAASVRFLGPEKRISMHDIRSIVPSYLLVREGEGILHIVQRCLAHKDIRTTIKFYLKTQNIFSTRIAKMQIEERAKKRLRDQQLTKLPAEIMAMLDTKIAEFQEIVKEHHFDDEAYCKRIQKAVWDALDQRSNILAEPKLPT